MDLSTKVSVKLLLEGVQNGETKNMLTSPISYNVLINIIAAGSSGDTLDEILGFLERSNIDEVNAESSKFAEITAEQTSNTRKRKLNDGSMNKHRGAPIISFLNGVWLDQRFVFKDSFHDLLQNVYKAKLTNFDSTKPNIVVEETNEWASASTKGLIKEILEEEQITPTTVLILGNSLYFKGTWEEHFDILLTTDLWFHLLNGEKIKARFMTGCYIHSYRRFQDFQVARIPYRTGGDVNRKFAMYIFLPNRKDGLEDLLKQVNSEPEFVKKHCDLPDIKILDSFYIPKFKFSYTSGAGKDIMKSMGLTLPFDEKRAELNEMIGNAEEVFGDERLHVTNIVQKAYIEVNEQGTEAVAVTFSQMRGGGYATSEFIADHPFMFIIREEHSGLLFFSGTVLNPLES